MKAKLFTAVMVLSFLPLSAHSSEGKAIVVDGVNDFGNEYLVDIDTLDPPPYIDGAPYKTMGIGDASIRDNWNVWIGTGDDRNPLANPVEMGRLFVTNDMFYLYIGLDHTDTDGKPAGGGAFGYWNTQVGVAIDVDSTPSGGNQASWSGSGFTDPWGNNQEFLHAHRPDYVTWFDHHSDDYKLYRWNVQDETWVEINQDSIDAYHEEFGFRPGHILLKGGDGVSHREPGDPGPYSGADRFVEFQIPLRAIGINYGAITWDTVAVSPESLPPVVSVQAWCAQPGRGAYDVVPSDDQICSDSTMGDWGGASRVTQLDNYAHYTLLSYRDQIPPQIEFEELPTSTVLNSSVAGLERISVVSVITDKVSPMAKRGIVANVRAARVYYTEYAEMRIDTLIDSVDTRVDTLLDTNWVLVDSLESCSVQQMANIEGTQYWIADIPDTVFFLIWAQDLGGANAATLPAPLDDSQTVYVVYPPPEMSLVEWFVPLGPDTISVFAPDGTMFTVFDPQGPLLLPVVREVRISVPDSTTFTEPSSATFSPPYATAGEITSLGIFRKTAVGTGERVLTRPGRLMLHYTDSDAAGLDEERFRIYYWNEESERWTRCGGHPDPGANVVTADVVDLGVYGLFYDPNVESEIAQVIDDVELDPNPFSPNQDGLYDNLHIQFSLNTDALVSVSVYNRDGKLVRTIAEDEELLRGAHNILWDGRDEDGDYVPYGFYMAFVYAKSVTTDLPLAKFAKGIGVIR